MKKLWLKDQLSFPEASLEIRRKVSRLFAHYLAMGFDPCQLEVTFHSAASWGRTRARIDEILGKKRKKP